MIRSIIFVLFFGLIIPHHAGIKIREKTSLSEFNEIIVNSRRSHERGPQYWESLQQSSDSLAKSFLSEVYQRNEEERRIIAQEPLVRKSLDKSKRSSRITSVRKYYPGKQTPSEISTPKSFADIQKKLNKKKTPD